MARAPDSYPQKGLVLYINIKNKLYKKSLFLFFNKLTRHKAERGEREAIGLHREPPARGLAIFCAEGFIQRAEVPILAAFLKDPFFNRHEVRGGFPFPF